MTTVPRRLAAVLVALGAPGLVLGTRAAPSGRLPDPLPIHWGLRGDVDGTLPPDVLLGVALLVSSVCALAAVGLLLRRTPGYAERGALVALVWAGWLAAGLFVVPGLVARDAARAEDATLVWWAVPALPLVPALAALLVARLVPPPSFPQTGAAPVSSIRLGPSERVTWLGGSSSRGLAGLSGVLAVGAGVAAFWVWPLALVLGLVSVVLLWARVVSVRVDARSVTIGWGPTRWPRVSAPLTELLSARAEEIEPLRWGGWGYRLSPRGTAVVTRRGPGVVLERRGRLPLAVTVDDAERAAEVVNALLAREDAATADQD